MTINICNKGYIFRVWLEANVLSARKKLLDCWPIREDVVKLKQTISDSLGVLDVIWECGWGIKHWYDWFHPKRFHK